MFLHIDINKNEKDASANIRSLQNVYEEQKSLVIGDIKEGKSKLYLISWQDGKNLVSIADVAKKFECVHILAIRGASTTIVMNALFWAASEGDVEYVRLLLDRGTNVNIRHGKQVSASFLPLLIEELKCMEQYLYRGQSIEVIQKCNLKIQLLVNFWTESMGYMKNIENEAVVLHSDCENYYKCLK